MKQNETKLYHIFDSQLVRFEFGVCVISRSLARSIDVICRRRTSICTQYEPNQLKLRYSIDTEQVEQVIVK